MRNLRRTVQPVQTGPPATLEPQCVAAGAVPSEVQLSVPSPATTLAKAQDAALLPGLLPVQLLAPSGTTRLGSASLTTVWLGVSVVSEQPHNPASAGFFLG